MTGTAQNERGLAGTRTRRTLTMVAVAGAVALALAACGKNDSPVSSAANQTATTQAPVVSATTVPIPTTAAAKPTVATASNATFGTILVDATSGKTLYVFDKDAGGVSACTGNCAGTWPAVVLGSGVTTPVAGTGVSGLTTAARPDDASKLQVLWNGKPLYTYAADTAAGDTKGDGVGGIWHVAKAA